MEIWNCNWLPNELRIARIGPRLFCFNDTYIDGYILDFGRICDRVRKRFHALLLELRPLTCLAKVLEERLARGYTAIQIEAHTMPDVTRILFFLHEPVEWHQQALYCRSGHDNTMIPPLAHAKQAAISHRTDVNKVGRIIAIILCQKMYEIMHRTKLKHGHLR